LGVQEVLLWKNITSELDFEGHKYRGPKRLPIKAVLMQTVMKRKLGLFRHYMQNGGQQTI